MRNPVVGCLFFCLLIIGITVGVYFEQLEKFGFIGLGLGLLVILIFRRKS